MSKRQALLIGSLPFTDEETCMRRALALLGSKLIALPDGEIGEKSQLFPRGNRIAWVTYAIEVLTADRSSWRTVKQPVRGSDGLPTGYGTIQKLAPLRGPGEMARTVRFGYDAWFRRSYPIFQRLRGEAGLPRLPFLLGVPTGFALGFAFASRVQWLRYTGAFNTVIAREVDAARAEADGDLIVQIEVPPEVFVAHLLPRPLMGLALRPILDQLGKLEPGARIGIHLCLGDFHNKALVHPRTPHRMVAFANRLVAAWPAAHRLEYVHFPFAEGDVPPPREPSWYRPLAAVRLPHGARFVAGLAHEKLALEDARRIVEEIEAARGNPVDIAASCGLGRRTPAQAEVILSQMQELVAGA